MTYLPEPNHMVHAELANNSCTRCDMILERMRWGSDDMNNNTCNFEEARSELRIVWCPRKTYGSRDSGNIPLLCGMDVLWGSIAFDARGASPLTLPALAL